MASLHVRKLPENIFFLLSKELRQNIVVLLKKPLYFCQKVLIRQLLQKRVVPGCYKELCRKLKIAEKRLSMIRWNWSVRIEDDHCCLDTNAAFEVVLK